MIILISDSAGRVYAAAVTVTVTRRHGHATSITVHTRHSESLISAPDHRKHGTGNLQTRQPVTNLNWTAWPGEPIIIILILVQCFRLELGP
jgi:hypothetical protein